MDVDSLIKSVESEWEPDTGFFWKIRQGEFHQADYEQVVAVLAGLPDFSTSPLPPRLVSLLWYVPLFMHWQIDRIRQQNADVKAYMSAMNSLQSEIERILGVP